MTSPDDEPPNQEHRNRHVDDVAPVPVDRVIRSSPHQSYRPDRFRKTTAPDVVFEVELANGEEAEALRRLQRQVMVEVMTWIVQQRMRTPADSSLLSRQVADPAADRDPGRAAPPG